MMKSIKLIIFLMKKQFWEMYNIVVNVCLY